MIWFVVVAVLVVSTYIVVYAPYETVREAKRLGIRGDGSESPSRATREVSHRKRMIRNVVIVPLLVTFAISGGMVVLDFVIPNSPLADLLGGVTSETATVSEELVQSLEDELAAQMRAEREMAEADSLHILDAQGQTSFEFFTTHWPLRIIFLFVLAALLVHMHNRVMKARQAYDKGVGERRREYARLDLQALSETN